MREEQLGMRNARMREVKVKGYEEDDNRCKVLIFGGFRGTLTAVKNDLEARTKCFALKAIDLIDNVPKTRTARVLTGQLLRSATSVGANYREAIRAESRRDFVHKLAIVEKEISETLYWIDLILESRCCPQVDFAILRIECEQLLRIFVASVRTAKRNTPTSRIRAFRIPNS